MARPRTSGRPLPKRSRFHSGRGGARENAGRFTYFPGKVPIPVSVILTQEGRDKLADTRTRLEMSASDVIEALIRAHGESLAVPPSPYADAPRADAPTPARRNRTRRS